MKVVCSKCGGDIDTGYRCVKCGHSMLPQTGGSQTAAAIVAASATKCLCPDCRRWGGEDCPRAKAEEEVLERQRSEGVASLRQIIDEMTGYATCIARGTDVSSVNIINWANRLEALEKGKDHATRG